MVTSTVSVSLSVPNVTVRLNVSVTSSPAVTSGAVKLGVAVAAPVSVTVGLPPVWLHEYSSGQPTAGLEPLPSKLTASPSYTVWSGPASATNKGETVPADTVTFTVSVSLSGNSVPAPNVTVRLNVSVTSAVTSGAVKLGVSVAAPVRLTVGVPPVCRHE